MSISLGLLYLLLILFPTQLGRHFFFPFSSIAGIRSDYLTPTVYLTDIVILFILGIELVLRIKKRKESQKIPNVKLFRIFLLFPFYLLFNSLFVATNKAAAFYAFIKIVEYVLLGTIIVRVKPKMSAICTIFAFDVLYVSFIAIGQFILQRSIGGVFWFLGERTFYASTPGIAAISWEGRLFLRPYATFPHPNVLGGFLAVVLPFILFWFLKHKKEINVFFKSIYIASFSLGGVALFLSFSRSAWLVFFIGLSCLFFAALPEFRAFNSGNGFFAKQKKEILLVCFYLLMLFSVVIPLSIPSQQESFVQRENLLQASIQAVLSQPLYGVGLNNSVVRLSSFLPRVLNFSFFQPVHNMYMLLFVETGFIGFTFFLLLFALIFTRVLRASPLIRIALLQLFFLGVFDHYLFTLQQGQLLFTLFAALAFSKDSLQA